MYKYLVKSLLVALYVAMLVSSIAPAFARIQDIEKPRLDDIYISYIGDYDAQVVTYQTGEIDVLPDLMRWSDISQLMNENQTLIATPEFSYTSFVINCRDYVPGDAGQYDAGRPLAPLNDSIYRQALQEAAPNSSQKDGFFMEHFGGPLVTSLETIVPYPYGSLHWEPSEYHGGNFMKAGQKLFDNGYSIIDNLLIQPNGQAVRDSIGVFCEYMFPYIELAQRYVDQWNEWRDYMGITNMHFYLNLVSPYSYPDVLSWYRNFDIALVEHYLDKQNGILGIASYVYKTYKSSQDFVGGANIAGIKNRIIDETLGFLKHSWAWEEIELWMHSMEQKIYDEFCPEIVTFCNYVYSALKDLEYYTGEVNRLVDIINQKGIGAINDLTLGLLRWLIAPEGGRVRFAIGDIIRIFHPGWAKTPSEKFWLKKVLDEGIWFDWDLNELPAIVVKTTVQPFAWEPLGILNGLKITIQIRNDVKYHDLFRLSIKDLKFSLGFSCRFTSPTLSEDFLWCQEADPYTLDVYLNDTSSWAVYDVLDAAFKFPEHIYGPNGWLVQHGYDPVTASVWEIPYNVGNARKALIGCGPYIFDYWDYATETGHLVKNPDYWVDGPIKQSVIGQHRVDPGQDFEYYVQLVNTGSTDEETGELAPMVIDYIDITVDGEYIDILCGPWTIPPFGVLTLGPYEYHFDTPGYHTLDCHTWAYGEIYDSYEHPMWITIREDLNLDFKVDVIHDIRDCAKAFGSYPGHPKWDERADINDDFKVDMINDIRLVAKKFGWPYYEKIEVFREEDIEEGNPIGVEGIVMGVDKLALLAPYIGLASTTIVATIVYVKRLHLHIPKSISKPKSQRTKSLKM